MPVSACVAPTLGEEISVTSRGAVVARLSPPEVSSLSAVDLLRHQDWIVHADKKPMPKLGLHTPISWRHEGPSFTELLLEDRE